MSNDKDGFGSRSSQLELYKLLVEEVSKAVEKSSASLLVQLKSATDSMEKKADDNFRLLSARIEENRMVSRGENERVVAKIDHIVEVLSQGNARFAVIEQRVTTIESRCSEESAHRHAHARRPPTDPFPAYRPAEEKKPASQKMNPFVVALLGAVAAALGGAITTWIIGGGLTVTPHSGNAVITAPKTP